MTYRITAASITDFKRIQTVELAPPADSSLILIGGKNAQGKTSILDAFTAALGGGRAVPSDPVRHGAKEAEIVLEFDGGALIVTRIFNSRGTSLEVRNAGGIVKSPQAMLDTLVANRFLDPLAFLALPVKEQRATLMRLIEGADRIDDLNGKRERAFTRRTEIGRDLEKAKGELARLEERKPGTPTDVTALTAELAQLADQQRAGDGLGHAAKQAQAALVTAEQNRDASAKRLAELEAQVAREREALGHWEAQVAERFAAVNAASSKVAEAAAAWGKVAPRRAEIERLIAAADAHNRQVFADEAHVKRRAEASEAVTKLDGDYAVVSNAIAEIDKRKAAILAAAKLPVEGLTVTDDGVELAGVPFAQASGAEKHRVAVALAIAASPNLDDIWVRDGALLDEDSLAAIAAQAAAAKKRLWVERVSNKDPGAIIIEDGQVRGTVPT